MVGWSFWTHGAVHQAVSKKDGQSSEPHSQWACNCLPAVTEIESIINSRPLSYVSAEDTEEPSTPSHLLIGCRVLKLPDHLGHLCDPGDKDFDIDSTQLTRRMKHLNNTLNHFWKHWRSEYLADLRESHRYQKKSCGNPQVAVGDVVIVHEEGLRRSFWKLGCIYELIVGRDGETRGATVKIAGKSCCFTYLNRPLQLLYPLEVHSTDLKNTPQTPQECESRDKAEDQPICQLRPQRVAARKNEEKRRLWTSELQDWEFWLGIVLVL